MKKEDLKILDVECICCEALKQKIKELDISNLYEVKFGNTYNDDYVEGLIMFDDEEDKRIKLEDKSVTLETIVKDTFLNKKDNK